MNTGQYTIKDIAKQLNLSASTVSRALRDLPDVKPETMRAVKDLAKQLNYLPNPIAQGLVKRRSYNIGVIIPDFMIHFYAEALSGIYKVANESGYNVMVCQTNETYSNELKSLKTLVSNRVDGLLIAISKETNNFDHLNSLNLQKMPLVVFNRVSDKIMASKVVFDDFQSGYKATRHLVDIPDLVLVHQRLFGKQDIVVYCGRCLKKMYEDVIKWKEIDSKFIIFEENKEEN